MINNLFINIRVTAIFTTFKGWVVVHLNNIRIPVIILNVHPIQAVADRGCGFFPETDHVGGNGIFRYALNPAVDDMSVH